MLHIQPDGDDTFRLLTHDGRAVGWIRGATIRLGSFDAESEALDAALLDSELLDVWLDTWFDAWSDTRAGRGAAGRAAIRPRPTVGTQGDDERLRTTVPTTDDHSKVARARARSRRAMTRPMPPARRSAPLINRSA